MLVAIVESYNDKTGNIEFNDLFFFDSMNDIYEFVKGETLRLHLVGTIWSSDTERRLPIRFEYKFNKNGIPHVKVKEEKKLIAEFKFNKELGEMIMVKKNRRK